MITTGAVLHCSLVKPGVGGTGQSNYRVKNISVYPLSQEYERTISCIGSVYNATELHGPLSAGALTFSTRRDSSSKYFSCRSLIILTIMLAPLSPKKRKGFFNSVEATSRRGGSAYPQSLGLDDTGKLRFAQFRYTLIPHSQCLSMMDVRNQTTDLGSIPKGLISTISNHSHFTMTARTTSRHMQLSRLGML